MLYGFGASGRQPRTSPPSPPIPSGCSGATPLDATGNTNYADLPGWFYIEGEGSYDITLVSSDAPASTVAADFLHGGCGGSVWSENRSLVVGSPAVSVVFTATTRFYLSGGSTAGVSLFPTLGGD